MQSFLLSTSSQQEITNLDAKVQYIVYYLLSLAVKELVVFK